jgi:hypothetical protein
VSENTPESPAGQTRNGIVGERFEQLARSISDILDALTAAPLDVPAAVAHAAAMSDLLGDLTAAVGQLRLARGGAVLTLPADKIQPGDRLIADLQISHVWADYPVIRRVSVTGSMTLLIFEPGGGHHAVSNHAPMLVERGPGGGDPEPARPAPPPPADPGATPTASDAAGSPPAGGIHSGQLAQMLAEAPAGGDPGWVDSAGWFTRARAAR